MQNTLYLHAFAVAVLAGTTFYATDSFALLPVPAVELPPPDIKPVAANELMPSSLMPVAAHELTAIAANELPPPGEPDTRPEVKQYAVAETPQPPNQKTSTAETTSSAGSQPTSPPAPSPKRSAPSDYNPAVY